MSIFAGATLLLAWVSRIQLRRPDSHGFYRFWAWESMLAHWILLRPHGLEGWFVDPLSPLHLLAWFLLVGAALMTSWAVLVLRAHGRACGEREDALLFPFEKTTQLVTGSLYGRVRHPMYAGLLFATWGVLILKSSWAGSVLAVVATACVLRAMRAEESENLRYFGSRYEAYMSRSKRFVPWVI